MTATDWIRDRRALIDGAPPAPWRYREGAYGDPANGPDHTKLTATHPEHGEQTIAEGGYDSWSGLGLALAADARTSLPAVLDALEAVLKLHEPREVEGIAGDCAAEECDHEDGKDCERVTLTICAACDDFAERVHPYYAEQNWHESEYPCLVVTAITTALGVES